MISNGKTVRSEVVTLIEIYYFGIGHFVN
jgi:hypothetical protein